MDGGSSEGSEARFAGYVEALGVVLGHADRQQPMHDYGLGLLLPIERKSIEPMAAVTVPAQVAATHQSLLHFVGNVPWSDAAMRCVNQDHGCSRLRAALAWPAPQPRRTAQRPGSCGPKSVERFSNRLPLL